MNYNSNKHNLKFRWHSRYLTIQSIVLNAKNFLSNSSLLNNNTLKMKNLTRSICATIAMVLLLSSYSTQLFANGASNGNAGVILTINGGSKTIYKVYDGGWGSDGGTSWYNIQGATTFSGTNLGNVNTLALNGMAIVGWTDNADFVAGEIQYKIWLNGTSEPGSITGTFDVGGYGSGCSVQNVQSSSSNNRMVGIDNQNVNLLSGLAPGVYNIKIYPYGQMRYNCGSYNQVNNAAVTATFTVNPTVTFNVNGGTGSMSTQYVTYNTATALTTNSLSISGGSFYGWNTAANGSGTAYANSANITTTSNQTLYAQWLPTITVTVGSYTYNGSAQGPSAVTGNTGAGTVTWSYVGTSGTTYGPSSTKPTNAGTYTATASVTAGGNFMAATSSATAFSIGKVALTITAGNQTVCYGTAAATVTSAGSYTPTGFVNSETAAVIGGSATYSTTYTASTAGGTTGVTITPITGSLTATNYSFSAATGTITINALPAISTSPSDQSVSAGAGTATFTVTATGAGLTYQWQENTGGGFANITNGGIYSGATTATLTLTNPASGLNGYTYRCVVSGTCTPSVNSNSATLTVTSNTITTGTIGGGTTTYCAGTTSVNVPFTYSPSGNFPSGGSCTFTAQLSDASGGWSSPVTLQSVVSTASSPQSISVTIPSGTSTGTGYKIRVMSNSPAVTGADNGTALTINALPSAPTASPQSFCSGASPTVANLVATGSSILWYTASSGGSSLSTGTALSTSNYYASQTVSGCESGRTAAVAITVDAATVAGSAVATTSAICTGGTTTVNLSGNTGSTIQWQQSSDNSSWSTVSGGSGGTTSSYTTAALSYGLYYRAQVTNGICAAANTSGVLVSINESNDASSIYSSSWTNGQNDNTTGFGAWALTSAGLGGFYSSGSSGVNNGGSRSWGLYAGGTGTGNRASAVRTVSLSTGNSLSISMANSFVTTSDTIGFALQNASGQNLMQFYFLGGAANYSIADNAGAAISTGIGYTTAGMDITIAYTASNTYTINVTPKSGSLTTLSSRTFSTCAGGQVPAQIRLFTTGAGGSGYDLFFNSLSLNNPVIYTHPTTTPQAYGVGGSASALTVAVSGSVWGYQWYSNTSSSNSGGTLIGGATSASYTPSTASSGTLYYYCVVTGTCASTTSNVSGAVTVTPAPIITSFSTANNNGTTTSGYVGTTVTITGSNLGTATALTVGGTSVFSNIVTNNATTITFTTILGLNGTITVTNSNGTGTSSSSYADLGYISISNGNWSSTSTWLNSLLPTTYAAVTINNNVTLDLSTDTVSSLTINSGKTFTASDGSARTLYINSNTAGNVTTLTNNGTWANGSGGSTVEFIGKPTVTGDAIHVVVGGSNGIIFNNVIISKSTGSTYNLGVNFGSSGTSLGSGGKLTIGAGGYVSSSIPSNFYTVNGNSTLQFSNTGGYAVTASDLTWPSSNSPSAINITAGTVALNYTRTATGSLIISGGGLTLGAPLIVNGSFTQSAGTFTASTYGVTMGGTGTISVTSGNNFYDLTINGTVTASTAFTATHSLTIGSGNSLIDGGNTITVSGASVVNNGTHSGAGEIKLTASADVTITGTGTFQNLENALTSANLIAGSNFNIAGSFTNTSGGVRGLNHLITFTGTGTLTNNSTMFGEYSSDTLSLAFNGTTTLAGSTGYIDAKNYTIGTSGTLICGTIGLNSNSSSPAKSVIIINGTLKTANSNGLWDGSTNNTSIRYSGGNIQTITLGGASTIVYNASGAQTISKASGIFNAAYYNLTCSNTSYKALQSDLTIGGTLNLTSASDYLSINGYTLTLNGAVSGSGSIAGSSTSGLIIGGTAGTINFTAANDTLKTFTLSSGSSATLGSQLNIVAGTTPGTVTIGSGATLTTGGYLTLLSDINGTARVDQVLGTVSGNVTAQRFVTAKSVRKYSFLGSPVSSTFRNGWQQQIYITGAGTGGVVCGATGGNGGVTDKYNSNGFDATQNSAASIFTYNATLVNGSRWIGISNTESTTQIPGVGYRVNVRGNRNSGTATCDNQLNSTSPSAPEAVTLIATGTLATGNILVSLNDTAGQKYTLVANPYPSQISYSAFQASNSGINNKMWTFSPFGNGNYTTYNSGVIANGATGYDNTHGDYIAVGQAFFVEANKNGSVTFQESQKISSAIPNTQYFGTLNNSLIRVGLTSTSSTLLDEVVIRFNPNGSKAYTPTLDATSFSAASQSLAIVKGDSHLAIATLSRNLNADTIQLNVASSTKGTFRLLFSDFEGIDTATSITLRDNYLNTTQDIRATNKYDFNVTADTASIGTNRFNVLIAKTPNILPVTFTSINASLSTKGVDIAWRVATEDGISNYKVERSIDGHSFTEISTVKAIGANNYSIEDVSTLLNTTYYRIKAIGVDGIIVYSNVVAVTLSNVNNQYSIYPNPVQDKLNITFNNTNNTSYKLRVLTITGIEVISKTDVSANGNTLSLPVNKLAAGVYSLELTDALGNKQMKKFVKE